MLVVCTGCAPPATVVTAPMHPGAPTYQASEQAGDRDMPSACGRPWLLDVIGGDGQVVVVCAREVRRQALDQAKNLARSLAPALDPARERVCACAERMRAPTFVDLVFTSKPEEGRVTVQASGEDDLDPQLGPPFVACVGTLVARFAPLSSEACSDAGKASVVYPVRLDLDQ
jgi:hypothetical protein